jgi:hypothetical protein
MVALAAGLARKRDLWAIVGPGPHPCRWCGAPVDWAEVAPLPPDVAALVVGQLGVGLVPACGSCWQRECAPRIHPRAVPPSVAFPRDWGPRRQVVREIQRRRKSPEGAYVWCFELECGHTVSRRRPGKTYCYCEVCRRRGPRIIVSRRERETVILAARRGS